MKRKIIIILIIILLVTPGVFGYLWITNKNEEKSGVVSEKTKKVISSSIANGSLPPETMNAMLANNIQKNKLMNLKFDNYNDFVILSTEVKKTAALP